MSLQTHNDILELRTEIEALNKKVDANRITEEDIDKIVNKVCEKIETRIYTDVGHGVMKLAWKGALILLILLAAYGSGVKQWFN